MVGQGGFFADEMKSLCYSDLSKQAKVQQWVRLPGDFFTVFPLKLHGGGEEYKERKGGDTRQLR